MQVAQQIIEETYCFPKLKGALFMKVDEYFNIPIYTTICCFFLAGLYKPSRRGRVILEAVKALRMPDRNDGCCQKLRILQGRQEDDYECLWVVQDEESITLMFPEDR